MDYLRQHVPFYPFVSKISLAALLMLYTSFSFAQTERTINKNQIKFSPLRTIDIINPGLELSYERLHKVRFSTQLSLAYMADVFGITHYMDYEGVRVALEEKFFLKKKPAGRIRMYISAEGVFSYTTIKDQARFGYESPWTNSAAESYNYLDTFGIHKKKIMLHTKFGIQIQIRKHFIMDVCAGIGIKYRDIEHFDRNVPDDKMERSRHPNIFYSSINESKEITLSLPVNIKLGYTF